MKQKLIALLITACVAFTGNSLIVSAEENDGQDRETIVLEAEEAVLSGVTLKDTENESEIYFDEAEQCILGLGEFSSATYTVPDQIDGVYDIYLYISKASNAFVAGSTPVAVTINNGEAFVPSIPVMPCSMEQMGMKGEPSYQKDMGLFKLESSISLDAGDQITVNGVAGWEFFFNEAYSSSMPAIGSVVLYPSGSEVEQGYDGYTFTETVEEKDMTDPLSGLTIGWLGSSVTYGQGAQGYSMADEIALRHADTVSYKYAISGTTLADCKYGASVPTDGEGSHGSYVARLKQLSPEQKYDLFIVQLSTNDATAGIPMGEISADQELASQNSSTVIGAMEYIIAYVKETWGCPVMFYTGTKYESEQYGEMVETLLKLQEKWGIGVINLWNDEDMNAVSEEQRALYIKEDGIHPLRDGYVEWWTPKFEESIITYLSAN